MSVTVAVPTARRPQALARLLDALPAALDGVADVDVLVVDNDVSGSARPVVAGRARYLLETQPGSAHARNRALAEVTTERLAFLDDDVVPQPGWLAGLLDTEGVAAGGKVVLDPTVPRPSWFDEAGIGGYVTAFDLGGGARPLTSSEYVVTASAVFDTAALRAVGGFDPQLGPRPGSQLVADDVHVVRELQRAGGEVWWQPSAVVVHDLPAERLRPGWLLKRAYLQGRSDWLLDEELMRQRALGGARVAVSWLGTELGRRRREGLLRRTTAFHLATDVSRTLGAVGQGLRWLGDREPSR